MPTFSAPFRLYLLKLPSGKRQQLTDEDKARALAAQAAAAAGCTVDTILVPSRYFYATTCAPGGRVRRVCTKQATKHLAKRWVDIRNAQAMGGQVEPTKILFEDALRLWREEKRLAKKSPKTLRDYAVMSGIWERHFGGLVVSEITQDDVLRYFGRREAGEFSPKDDEGKPRPPSAATLLKDRVLIGSFFAWAKRRNHSLRNPAEDAPTWKLEQKEPRALSAAELGSLLRSCRDPYKLQIKRASRRPYETEQEFLPPPHLYGVVLVASHTLLRLQNALGLRWRQVDLERGVIRVEAGEVKTRREIEVPLTPTLKAYLSSLEKEAPAALVFGDSAGSIKRSFASAAERAGLPGLKFHTLRKTGATLLLDAGVPLHVVQRLGGWKKPDVLLKHYAASTEAQRARAVQVLDGLGG